MYAPEHLIVNVKDAEKWECFVENAGSVFLGPWTPESVRDYASGTNHVLPTYGYAHMYAMAEVEGLEAHKRAATLRLKDIEARQVTNIS
ncbi:histidinol dehydrogenase, chloroplastic-like isoform X2 [Mangifera indica]|uniref:histidinol dehydrogenase, chloroplastic-like isoform X2 n=1 Tax=Mangifera indica TaxID=29780 RepID=UPI001CF93678|nr:histidinol dehydrogenase, chloroplastic-like isoform X2 [Mangifera indica]